MAWEELLKQQTGTDPRNAKQDGGTPPERETLIREICGETGDAERIRRKRLRRCPTDMCAARRCKSTRLLRTIQRDGSEGSYRR